jgi:hypothetical protein
MAINLQDQKTASGFGGPSPVLLWLLAALLSTGGCRHIVNEIYGPWAGGAKLSYELLSQTNNAARVVENDFDTD